MGTSAQWVHSGFHLASHPETIAEFRPRGEAALTFVHKTVKDQPIPLLHAFLILTTVAAPAGARKPQRRFEAKTGRNADCQ
jgi:hypothetical protein